MVAGCYSQVQKSQSQTNSKHVEASPSPEEIYEHFDQSQQYEHDQSQIGSSKTNEISQISGHPYIQYLHPPELPKLLPL